MAEMTQTPMRKGYMQTWTPCGAHCRTTGQPCPNPPMRGKARCRMHGGKSPGRPPTNGPFSKAGRAVRERLAFLMWILQEIRGGDKTYCRFRPTPERVERLLAELLSDHRKQ
ncbi:MAG: hypothetical protein JNM61_05395 [Zoogloeaceae bacterium]|nr:hypothetical protein [Zoogloeaceae bacterium]